MVMVKVMVMVMVMVIVHAHELNPPSRTRPPSSQKYPAPLARTAHPQCRGPPARPAGPALPSLLPRAARDNAERRLLLRVPTAGKARRPAVVRRHTSSNRTGDAGCAES